MQLNKEIQNKEKQNTDLILSDGATVRTKVRDNIELDLLCHNQPESAPVMQEIYELVVETIQLRSPVLRLGNNLFPMALVRERLLQLTSEHIRFVLDGLRNLRTDVKKPQEISSDNAVQCACHAKRQNHAGCAKVGQQRISSDAGVTPRRCEQIVKFEKAAEIF